MTNLTTKQKKAKERIDKLLEWCKKKLAVKVPENTKFEQGYRQAIESVVYLIETKEDIL